MSRITYFLLYVSVFLFLFGSFYSFSFGEETEYHMSYPRATLERVDEAYNFSTPPPFVRGPIRAAIVNHHLLAPELIARVMKSLETERPRNIILISPDHFSAGTKRISTSYLPWRTPYGDIQTEKPLIHELIRGGFVNLEDAPFSNEHGISGVVPFIKKSFPNSTIVPIIIKDTASDKSIDTLAKYLSKNVSNDTVVIGSFDFSHYLPLPLADFHDKKSIEVIRYFDYVGGRVLDIDSRQGLRFVSQFAEKSGARAFTLFDHTNSARITGRHDVADTTSYITGVFSSGELQQKEPIVTLLAIGDIMLDRGVRKAMDKHGTRYPFRKIERFLGGSDILVANLEGPITDNPSQSILSHSLTFTFSTSVTSTLKRLGFSLFSLANNHTLDFGGNGLTQTKKYLTKKSINFFGDPMNEKDISRIVTVRGARIGFVGFHGLVRGGREAVIEEIKKVRKTADTVIVYPHWGNEYKPFFSSSQQNDAHAFIDAGADIIIGAHPHVIQPVEIYKNRPIFYSLGNFVFDQTFSKETQQGLAVGIVITQDSYEFTIVPVESIAIQTGIMNTAKKKALLAWLSKKSDVSAELTYQIKRGTMVLLRK